MSRQKQSPGGNPPAPKSQEQTPAEPRDEKKAFDPEHCTLEEMHRETTVHSPFLA